MADEKTSSEVAERASRVMRDRNASAEARSVAASALSQADDKTATHLGGDLPPSRPVNASTAEAGNRHPAPRTLVKTFGKFRFAEVQPTPEGEATKIEDGTEINKVVSASPTIDIAEGEYRRHFDAKDQPFTAESPEERQILLNSSLFVEVEEGK